MTDKGGNKANARHVTWAKQDSDRNQEEGVGAAKDVEQVSKSALPARSLTAPPRPAPADEFKLLVITVRSLDTQYTGKFERMLDKADPVLKLAFNGVDCSAPAMKNNENPHYNLPYSFLLDDEMQRNLGIKTLGASLAKPTSQNADSDKYLSFEVIEHNSISEDSREGECKVRIKDYIKADGSGEPTRRGLKSVDLTRGP